MASVTATDGSASVTTTATASATRAGAVITVRLPWTVRGSAYSASGKVAGATVASKTSSSAVFVELNASGTKVVEETNPAAVTLVYPISAYAQAQRGGAGSTRSSSVRVTVPAAVFSLTLNPGEGGAVDPSTVTVTYGQPYGQLPTPTRPGWRFVGWTLRPEGGELLTPETVVDITQDATLTAVWTPDAFAGVYVSRAGVPARVREAYAVRDGQPARLSRAVLVRGGAPFNL